MSIFSFNQTESKHLTFKGVPIDGTLKKFVRKMKAAGFTYENGKKGSVTLQGDFAGYKDCSIYVSALQNKDLVCSIGVLFPTFPDWESLERHYHKLKEKLTTKYGEPTETVEEFQDPDAAKDDDSKLLELKNNHCKYRTFFETEKGDLVLEIIADNYKNGRILLYYYDKINSLEVEAAAMEDL